MAIRDVFKLSRKTFFNPRAWIDYESIKNQNETIKDNLKDLFKVEKPEREESFDEAMKRLGLTEEDVKLSITSYKNYALLFAFLGFISFLYAFYLVFRYTSLTGFILSIAVSALFFSQAFKYDFWAFQMQRRKLGATFAEWKQNILGGKDITS